MSTDHASSETETPILPTVYVETSVVSYLTSRPSPSVEIFGHQSVTRRWWRTQRRKFRLVTSEITLREAGRGNPRWARKRLAALKSIPLLDIPPEASDFVAELFSVNLLPLTAADDAVHLAAAVFNGVNYLLTWNCKHLANAFIRPRLEQFCRDHLFRPPVICTPQELMKYETEEMA
ncbi:MAG: type II toxin-antitoxin system VapC family toxin [Pirellulales bacterium]